MTPTPADIVRRLTEERDALQQALADTHNERAGLLAEIARKEAALAWVVNRASDGIATAKRGAVEWRFALEEIQRKARKALAPAVTERAIGEDG